MTKKSGKDEFFYYSRRKLAFYLLFNLGLLTLALFFSLIIFPQYEIIYSFAVGSSLLSVAAVAAALIIRHPLAVVNAGTIKIDFCPPLKWKDIKTADKVLVGHKCCKREIIVLKVKNLSKYKLNLMQRLIKNSEYSAFSIPLYAMDGCDAEAIEDLVKKLVR